MIRKTLAAAFVMAAAGTAYAQDAPTADETAAVQTNGDFTETVEYSNDKYKVETNRFWDNWFISAGGGVNLYFGDHDNRMKFGKRLAPAVDVAIGKWFTPGIGLRFMYSGLGVNGATQDGANGAQGPHSSGDPISGKPWQGYWLRNQDFNFYNFHADVMFNLTNLFCGYKEGRVYNIAPYVGVGLARVTDEPKKTNVTGHLGVLNTFRLCDALDLNLDVRLMMVNDDFDGEISGRDGEGMVSATLGLTYKFKKRGWDRSKTVVRYNNTEVNALRDRVNDLTAENDRLRKALEEGNEPEVRTIVKRIASTSLVTFEIGSAEISNQGRANLGLMAEVIKSGDPETVYTITGYADNTTGSEKRNMELSRERAEAVHDCLVEEFGVSESQLRIDAKGGVDNLFYDDPRLSRAVITRCAE